MLTIYQVRDYLVWYGVYAEIRDMDVIYSGRLVFDEERAIVPLLLLDSMREEKDG
jgi:hypothetical protein